MSLVFSDAQDILDHYLDEDTTWRIDHVSTTLWYVGITENASALTSDALWQVWEITEVGTETITHRASYKYDKVYDDRATLAYSRLSDISLDSIEVVDTSIIGDVVGIISSTGGNPAISYSIVSDPSSKFRIQNTNELQLSATVTSPTEYDVTIRATDADSETFDEAFVITAVPPNVVINSLEFDGSTETALTESGSEDAGLADGPPFSCHGWIKTTSTAGRRTFISKWGTSAKASFIFGTSGAKIEIYISSGGSNSEIKLSSSNLSKNVWNHVGFVFIASELKIYINGALDVTHVMSATTIFGSDAPIRIGNWVGGSWYFAGRIKDFALYNTELTAGNFTTLYNAGAYLLPTDVTAPAGLRRWYTCGDSFEFDTPDYLFKEEQDDTRMLATNMDLTNVIVDSP